MYGWFNPVFWYCRRHSIIPFFPRWRQGPFFLYQLIDEIRELRLEIERLESKKNGGI